MYRLIHPMLMVHLYDIYLNNIYLRIIPNEIKLQALNLYLI